MENDGNAGTASSSRWNPTKEQINMLENLYKQGIRTPTADQIQQITARLRAYGHIEGKNVFYWFQNHKARQRQKQKQENIAYFNRLFQKTSRFFYPPPCTNDIVACGGPYYTHKEDGGVQTQSHRMLLPVGYENKTNFNQRNPDKTTRMCSSARFDRFALQQYCSFADQVEGINVNFYDDASVASRTTLPLFPLHPSDDAIYDGRMEVDVGNSDFASWSHTTSSGGCYSGQPEQQPEQQQQPQPFFDFFSCSN